MVIFNIFLMVGVGLNCINMIFILFMICIGNVNDDGDVVMLFFVLIEIDFFL